MASSKVVSTNPDLPRDSSSISSLLSDPHPNSTMDNLLNSIYTPKDSKTVDDVWKEIVSGTHNHNHNHNHTHHHDNNEGLGGITLEDFLTKAGAVREEDVRGVVLNSSSSSSVVVAPSSHFPLPPPPEASSSSVEPFVNGIAVTPPSSSSVAKGKRRAVEEPVDKATLQKQRRMIKNRESAARSRERKQAYTSELEYLVHQLEQENARLLNEEADMKRQRYKQLLEHIIPVDEMTTPKPTPKLQRTNSAPALL